MGMPLAAQRGLDTLKEKWPNLEYQVWNCRKIAGSTTYSQHSWGNAIDILGPTKTLDEVAFWLQEHRDQLDIRVLLWRVKNHYDHIHIDFWPKGYGTPPCVNSLPPIWQYPDGLMTGIYKLVTEDEVPQFTDEEAAELKLFLKHIKDKDSNVGFVKYAIDLIRKERSNALHSHQGEVLVDVKARTDLALLKEYLRQV